MSILINLKPVNKTDQNKTYKDINISNLFGESALYDLRAVKNRIRNMFEWTQGSRILNPEFGNILEKIKYEPINEVSMKNAEALIRKMFSFEPEITVKTINITPDYDRNELNIRVDYEVPNLDIVSSQDFIVEVNQTG